MLEAAKNRRSWVTQRIANRFPAWSRLRQTGQSIGQQLLEPLGREIDNLYWGANYDLSNSILLTSDTNQLHNMYSLKLPETFEWRYQSHADRKVYLSPTSVVGVTSSGERITLTQAYENSIEDMWFGAPTRVSTTTDSYASYNIPFGPTQVQNLSGSSPLDLPFATRLYVTVIGATGFVKNYSGQTYYANVEVVGLDSHGFEVTEKVYFTWNGTRQTKNAFSEITRVNAFYLNDEAYVRLDWLPVAVTEVQDLHGLYINDKREKIRFFYCSNDSGDAYLEHRAFGAVDLFLVEEGDEEKDTIYSIELLDSSGNNYSVRSLAAFPKRKWLVMNDGEYIHFHWPDIVSPNMVPIAERSTEPIAQIYSEVEAVKKGDEVYFDIKLSRPFWRVIRHRWSLKKPDGTRVGLDETGTEITYSSSGWILNRAAMSSNEVGLYNVSIPYTFSESGAYTLYLESTIRNITEDASTPIEHTDVLIINVPSDTAESSVLLPTSLGIVSYFVFDAFNQPWCVGLSGVTTKVNLHYDKYVVDYFTKTIYTREEFSSMEVEA